jgi:scyllo-inositol 2-dehydrogenase (NAD+)
MMTAKHRTRLKVGVIGLGRLGKVYVRDLASRIPDTTVVAVADTDASLADAIAEEFGIPKAYGSPIDLIGDRNVDAVVIVTPTHTHRDLVVAAARSKKPTFCEKPPALSLAECAAMADAIQQSGSFFQMGFMRRFDPGYTAAKQKIEEGAIGRPVVFKATSRDPFRPSLEYANPTSSGGIMVDMGIHDFDLARWFMGEVATVSAIGAVLAYPEMASIGDIDNAIATLVFADGRLGVVDLTRNGVYGYDITTELLGDAGTVRVGYLRETPLLTMTKNNIAHDTVPYFMERFERAYTIQLQNFAQNVLNDRAAPVVIKDGIEALRVALAATAACKTGQSVKVSSIQ